MIGSALIHKQTVAVAPAPNGTLIVKPLGVFARFWHWKDAKFHNERMSKLASVVAQVIAAQQRLSIAAAAEDPSLKVARNLLKQMRLEKITSPSIDTLKKEVTAAKLGLFSSVLHDNPGLQKFAEAYHLERYLLGYKDTLHLDPSTQKVFLRKEGKLHPWQEIYEESKSWPKPAHSPNLAWVYGPDGIQYKDMYDWNELKPFMQGNPADWNHQYVFEFCACYNPNSIKNGNHTWFRLKTPSGDIYSVGLYRPDKDSWSENLRSPLRIKPGYLMQPDVSEFWDFTIATIDFAITEEMFLNIKQTVEADKNNQDQVFQLFNNNCMLYCKKLAKIGGVDLPSLDNILFFIAPPSLADRVSKFINMLPSFIQKICLVVTAFFLNVAQMTLGGCSIDKDLNEQQRKRAVPHLTSFRDLFNTNKIYLNHPNTMTFKTRPKVMKWRRKEIEAINENDNEVRQEKENKIKLSLPPSFYTTSFE